MLANGCLGNHLPTRARDLDQALRARGEVREVEDFYGQYMAARHGGESKTVPPEIGQLTNLTTLWLNGNQLDPELLAASTSGIDDLKAYLASGEYRRA